MDLAEIQNEILEIVAKMIPERMTCRVRESKHRAIIVDETSDTRRTKQIAVCLRYVYQKTELKRLFYATLSTEDEVLYHLVKDLFRKLELQLEDVVTECFDGATNVRETNRGLATRMKECSSLVIYIHCYWHWLNSAIQDTMTENEPLRNGLGTIQVL